MILFALLLAAAVGFRVRTIEIRGNEYLNEGSIRKVMLTRPANLLRKGLFNEDIFKGDMDAIKNLYEYDGFLDVGVVHELSYDSTEHRVEILLNISEGRRYFTDAVGFSGNTVLPADSMKHKMTLRAGEPFDRRKVDADNYTIRYSYDDLGYADVEVESEYRIRDSLVDVMHRIKEGSQQFVDRIDLIGLKKTRPSVVEREISISSGDLLRYARILDSQRRLYRLGIFTTIRTRVVDTESAGRKNVQFLLTERNRATVNFRIGYGTRDMIRIGAGVTHRNMFGRAWQGMIEGKLSMAEQRVSTQMILPRMAIVPVDLGLGLFLKRLEEIGYVTNSLGGNVTTRYELQKNELSAKYELERVRTYYIDDDSTDIDLLHGITVGWITDRRDDPFHTKKGSYAGASLEMSGIILPSDIDYVRCTAQLRLYRPVVGLIIAASVKAGMAMAVSPTTEVPIYKRFYCGGASSVRGFSERSIGPVDENGNPAGGRFLGECSGEVRFPIYRFLGGVLFVDGGNVWQNLDDISASFRWGVGGGLRLKSFIGSIRLDYGFKIGREEGETLGVLHFAIGEAF